MASERGMCVAALRTLDQWDATPQALANKDVPPIELVCIGDAPKREQRPSTSSPFSGVRVLELTRVLAGPTCGRTLAGQLPSRLFRLARTLQAMARTSCGSPPHTSPRCPAWTSTHRAASARRSLTLRRPPAASASNPSRSTPTSSCSHTAPTRSRLGASRRPTSRPCAQGLSTRS